LPDADVLIATWWETAEWMNDMPDSKGAKVHLIQGYEAWGKAQEINRVHAALQSPNCKIVISNELKKTLDTHVGPLDITVIPNAVDLEQFDAPKRHRNTVPTVGFIYGRAHIKAADLYLEACELARQQLPNLQIVAFSSEQPSAELPLPKGTIFFYRPPQHQIASLYARCDAWLFASRIDSFGLPLLEAMACRTPVIGVPVGAAPELLVDGAGILVPHESTQMMANAIVEICTKHERDWQSMSQLAYDKSHAYSWDDAADRLFQVLENSHGFKI
jgi:glycosyltransferase involved in cell wall biosynthesis